MKAVVAILVLIFSLFVEAKESGGGVIVGNGAGFAEGIFQQSYQSLPLILDSIIATDEASFSDKERKLLENINKIAKQNSSKKDRLLFLSEKDHPGFFTTGENEPHRFAKTFATPESSIFINLDWIYGEEGKIFLNHSSAMALLIHEIGHQTGEKDHSELDILGAKIKTFTDGQTNQYNYHIIRSLKETGMISFLITNLEQPQKSSLLRFKNIKNQWSNLTTALLFNLKCGKANNDSFDVEISNGHFAFNPYQQLEFKAWVQFSCKDRTTKIVTGKMKNLNISFDQNFEMTGLELID